MQNEGPFKSTHGIENHGIADAGTVYWNLPPARLYELAIQRGEVLSLVGGSGTGKTVLLRQILGLEHPTRGHVTVLGDSLETVRARAARAAKWLQEGE